MRQHLVWFHYLEIEIWPNAEDGQSLLQQFAVLPGDADDGSNLGSMPCKLSNDWSHLNDFGTRAHQTENYLQEF